MKKTLAIILAILMIVTTIPMAFAADVVKSGTCGANGGNVKWTLDSDGTLTISGTGNMADYQSYPDVPWADYKSDVKKLIIEDGVTSIAEYTAYGCFYATSIYIGKDVKSIGPIYTTFYCRDLETITVSEDNEYYKSVDNVLFSKDGKELLKVACKAFSGTYNVPDGVVKIDKKAFDICKNIEKVVLPDSVEEIGEYAFYQCKSLKILDIGMAKISSVANGVFEWIEHPVEVIADKDNEYVSVVNGSLFSKIDGTLFYAYVTDNKCVVPYGVKIIPEFTIYIEDGSVVVPDTVETIERNGIDAFDSVVHYLGTESQLQEIYEGDMSDFDFEWLNMSMHYCVQQSNIPASCTDDGVTEWYCSTCDETIKYVTGYAFGHDIVEVEAKAPTCTEIGWDAYEYCTACTYTTYVEKEALNHKDTLVKVEAKANTCTEIGWDAYEYCTACDYTTYVEKEALKHSFTKYEVTEEAKCGVAGKKVAVCDNGCGATDEKAIEALKHSLVLIKTTPAKCGEPIVEFYDCEFCYNCEVARPKFGTALFHSFTKYEITEAPTCNKAGEKAAPCDNGCGEIDVQTVPALDDHVDADGDYKCDFGCGHEFEKPAPEEPTPDTPDEPTDDACDHLCHKSGILGFFWKIVRFFSKLFKLNPVCECGAAHY